MITAMSIPPVLVRIIERMMPIIAISLVISTVSY
jgi:hypothetical protein